MEVKNIPVERISPSKMNPRKTFDDTSIEELSQNIERQGLLQPITVRAIEYEDFIDKDTMEVVSISSKYEIICGERRYRACKMLAERKPGFTIPCIVRDMTDDEAFEAMITENLQRQDVDPVEEAIAFSLLLKNGKSIQDIALKFGKSTRFVQDRTKLTNLIPPLLEALREERIPISGAMMLAKANEEVQKDFEEELNDSESTFEDIKDFINRQFGILKEQQFYSEDGTFGDYPLCANCEFNTANHGCLFHEMKSDKEKCTHTECMKAKIKAYVLNKIIGDKDNFVKEGESLEFGKKVVIAGSPEGYWSDKKKEAYQEYMAAIKEHQIQVVNPINTFEGQCYYDESDSRTQEFIKQHKVVKCVRFMDFWANPKYEEAFYYVKSSIKENTDGTIDTQAFQIDAKKKRNIELQEEKINDALMERMAILPRYDGNTGPLSEVEKNVLDALIFEECGYMFVDQLTNGLCNKKEYKSNLEYIKQHPEDINSIYRAYIREKLSKGNSSYLSRTKRDGLRELLLDQDKERSQKIIDDIEKRYKRKNEKLDEKLK